MNQIDKIIADARDSNPVKNEPNKVFIELDDSPEELIKIPDGVSSPCHIPMIQDIFSWKKHFSYLFTGNPNAGKSTFTAYLMVLKSLYDDWKWCIWTPEMEDAYLNKDKSVKYHIKDFMNLLVWTYLGLTPFEYQSKKRGIYLLHDEELKTAYKWVQEHFKFTHIFDRTPGGIIESFKRMNDKYDIDGFEIDPWKSVKQNISGRDDIWLEDTLFSIKEFTLESDSLMIYVVHPKTLRDPKGADGEYRMITPYDLNGGAAWFNSMDVIVSLRPIMSGKPFIDYMEMYTSKAKKQHIFGVKGMYEKIYFDTKRYRYLFGEDKFCPIERKSMIGVPYMKRVDRNQTDIFKQEAPY